MVSSQQQIENVLAGTADYNFLPEAMARRDMFKRARDKYNG